MVRMVAGRLFHMSGPATEKARLPNCVLLRLTAAARVVEEQNRLLLIMLKVWNFEAGRTVREST